MEKLVWILNCICLGWATYIEVELSVEKDSSLSDAIQPGECYGLGQFFL